MKRYIGIWAMMLLLTGTVFAQESSPTDEIVVKATDAVIFQMKANVKLTDDQAETVRPIIADTIAKTRNLQQSLSDGTIDGPTLFSQRQALIDDENQQLSGILAPDQMKVWLEIENRSDNSHRHASSH